jgi:hypothetical protein
MLESARHPEAMEFAKTVRTGSGLYLQPGLIKGLMTPACRPGAQEFFF